MVNKTEMEVVLIDCEDKASNVVSKSGFKFCDRFIITVGSLILPFLKYKIDFTNTAELNKKFRFFVTKNINGGYVRYEAKVAAVFESGNVKNCVNDIFGGWTLDSSKDAALAKQVLPVIFILYVDHDFCVKDDLNKELRALMIKTMSFEQEIIKGCEVLVDSVPFGNKYFFNNYSCGIVSNVLGKNNCFILSDCPTVPGSEGSPVFLKRR